MNTLNINSITTSRKKDKCTINYEKGTIKRTYTIKDIPVYEKFHIETPLLSGIGSIFNIPGDENSYRKYFSPSLDRKALASDWKKVGVSIFEAIANFRKTK